MCVRVRVCERMHSTRGFVSARTLRYALQSVSCMRNFAGAVIFLLVFSSIQILEIIYSDETSLLLF